MTGKGKITAIFQALRTRVAHVLRYGGTASDSFQAAVLPKPEGHQPMRAPLAGVMYENRFRAVAQLSLRETVQLQREPTNPFDKNAILVHTQDGQHLGHIGKGIAAQLAPYMDAGHNPMQAVVTELVSDISGSIVGAAVNFYLPESLCAQINTRAQELDYFCDVGSEGAVYLLVNCDEAALNQITERFTQSALLWLRSGLSYRPATNGKQYRWYVRFEDGISQERVERFLRETLRIHDRDAHSLNEWVASFDEENVALKAKNVDLEKRAFALQMELDKTKEQAVELERAAKVAERHRPDGWNNEIGCILQSLLPNIQFLRDSIDVITRELHSYQPILQILHVISANPAQVKAKRVESADGWWERHFSTGQKDDGRIYYKHIGDKWLTLVSFKASQRQDLQYLEKY